MVKFNKKAQEAQEQEQEKVSIESLKLLNELEKVEKTLEKIQKRDLLPLIKAGEVVNERLKKEVYEKEKERLREETQVTETETEQTNIFTNTPENFERDIEPNKPGENLQDVTDLSDWEVEVGHLLKAQEQVQQLREFIGNARNVADKLVNPFPGVKSLWEKFKNWFHGSYLGLSHRVTDKESQEKKIDQLINDLEGKGTGQKQINEYEKLKRKLKEKGTLHHTDQQRFEQLKRFFFETEAQYKGKMVYSIDELSESMRELAQKTKIVDIVLQKEVGDKLENIAEQAEKVAPKVKPGHLRMSPDSEEKKKFTEERQKKYEEIFGSRDAEFFRESYSFLEEIFESLGFFNASVAQKLNSWRKSFETKESPDVNEEILDFQGIEKQQELNILQRRVAEQRKQQRRRKVRQIMASRTSGDSPKQH